MKLFRHSAQSGSALISIIVVLPFLILITSIYMQLAVSSLTVARKDQSQTFSQFTTDAGIDLALQYVNQDPAWTGTGGEVVLQNENNVRTTYDVTVVQNNPNSRTLTSVGRTYRPATSTTPATSRTIQVDLRPIASGTYSIVTGVGGLFMSNSAKIVGGDVLVNGEIEMSNTAQIGLTTNPVKVEVAHQNCPVPATTAYPRLCNSSESGQPISISNPARIYGTVRANNQTDGSRMSNPGLVSGTVTAGALPTHDRTAQKSAVNLTNPAQNPSGASSSCSGNNTTRTWNANIRIVGDVSISGSCKVTIMGNVWITGKLSMSNSAQLIVSNTLGTIMPDLMVDGVSAQLSNSAMIVSNSSSTGVRLITYWSRASCSPDCADVTGPSLYNSRNDETISLSNSSSATESILYSKWTRVSLNNTGGVGALIGQTVNLSNSATVTFGSSVSTGGTKFWVIDGYRRSF
jgi:hypothetical protein